MILQPATVQLTKINYFNESRIKIPSISQEIFDNEINMNRAIIKKNIFGHKWVLKINENESNGKNNKKHYRLSLYITVTLCIIIALISGLYFTFDNYIIKSPIQNTTISNRIGDVSVETITDNNDKKTTTIITTIVMKSYCENCTGVCLKLNEFDLPKCLQALDDKDPTGCGGYCSINTQFCQLLDIKLKIYQCSDIKTQLKCSKNQFNCGSMCIDIKKRCDGIVHCSNQFDEINCACNLDSHFHCGQNTSCLLKSKQCNGIVDCWDKSDEIDCYQCLDSNQFLCKNGECITKEKFCDGIYHCTDQSDEPHDCQMFYKIM